MLKLTEAARPLLRGEQKLDLVAPRIKAKAVKKKVRRKLEDLDYDQDLFDALRERRKELATAAGVPPFIIFGDQSLAEMAAFRPVDLETMREINGVGELKLKRYGEEFLAVINGFSEE